MPRRPEEDGSESLGLRKARPPTPLKEQKSAEVIENKRADFCEVQKSDRKEDEKPAKVCAAEHF
jgi:hypothetical protein